MWKRRGRTSFDRSELGIPLSDLASQLEDLRVHVMDCERWAKFDDRLDLALRCAGWRPNAGREVAAGPLPKVAD